MTYGALITFLLALVAPTTGLANCFEQQTAVFEAYDERRTAIGEDLNDRLGDINQWWQSEVVPTLGAMNASVISELQSVGTEQERAPIRAAYHSRRTAYLVEARADFHEGRRIAQEVARDRVRDLEKWKRDAILSLRAATECRQAFNSAISEDIYSERRVRAFGEERPMDQAVAEFHSREDAQEELRQLEKKIAAVDDRMRGRTETLAAYDNSLEKALDQIPGLIGNDGLDGFGSRLKENAIENLKNQFGSSNEEIDVAAMLSDIFEREMEAPRKLTRREILDKIGGQIENDLRGAASGALNKTFMDAIGDMIENSTFPEKVDLVNRIEKLQKHRDGLQELIEIDDLNKKELEDLLDKARSDLDELSQ